MGTKPRVFSGKVAPVGDERYLVCAAGAGWILSTCDWFRTVGVAARCSVRVCVRIYRVFLQLGPQIALEWLHDCCYVVLPCA